MMPCCIAYSTLTHPPRPDGHCASRHRREHPAALPHVRCVHSSIHAHLNMASQHIRLCCVWQPDHGGAAAAQSVAGGHCVLAGPEPDTQLMRQLRQQGLTPLMHALVSRLCRTSPNPPPTDRSSRGTLVPSSPGYYVCGDVLMSGLIISSSQCVHRCRSQRSCQSCQHLSLHTRRPGTLCILPRRRHCECVFGEYMMKAQTALSGRHVQHAADAPWRAGHRCGCDVSHMSFYLITGSKALTLPTRTALWWACRARQPSRRCLRLQ